VTTSSRPSRRATPVSALPLAVFTAPGPVVSVYFRTEPSTPRTDRRAGLRWRSLRDRLAARGAPDAALEAVDPVVDDGAQGAAGTVVAIAGPTGLLHTSRLSEGPGEDIGEVGPLAHLTPLLAAVQPLLPHLVVATDRLGAELVVVLPDAPDVHHDVDGEELHVTRSAPGGWSQRRFQQRAENRWQENAGKVAGAVTALVDRHQPRVIVLSGDVRAVQFLRDQLPPRAAELIVEVQGDYSTTDEALRRGERVVEATAADDTARLLAELRGEHRPHGLAVSGAASTLDAIATGQAAVVLLDPDTAAGATAGFGPELHQVASTSAALVAGGVERPRSAPLADVAVRGARGTAADVRIVPGGSPELAPDGVAALLRHG
jgi:hypothetical protein